MKTALIFYAIYYIWLNLPGMYFHRDIIHKHVKFSSCLIKITKIINWTRTNNYRQYRERIYAAAHIQHHRYSDTPKDPHSPLFKSKKYIAFNLALDLTADEIDEITGNCHFEYTKLDEWLEIFSIGRWVLLLILYLIFSYYGILLWLLMLTLGPVEAYFAVIAHSWPGYVNIPGPDNARNFSPWGIFYNGEELHSNHHRQPNRANMAMTWWEIDTGYWILKLLSLFKLVKFNKSGVS